MHEHWMKLAIQEAEKGRGLTSPNPTVGAVIVKDNKIIGQGFHPKAGMPHAERMALADARSRFSEDELANSTIYVTL